MTIEKIGILGGTGPAGSGLGVRLASKFDVILGSRDPKKGLEKAREISDRTSITRLFGGANLDAAKADCVILATPFDGTFATIRECSALLKNKLVISMVSILYKLDTSIVALASPKGSVVHEVADLLPESRVGGCFHHLAAASLLNVEEKLDADVLVVGANNSIVEEIIWLVDQIEGLRGIGVGGFEFAGILEAFTSVLIGVNRRYRAHSSIKITGIS